jgi:hypothetical protein
MTMFAFFRRSHGARTTPRRPTIRPRLEILEDRCVPSTMVTSAADDGSAGTLPWAIANTAQHGTIDISQGLGPIVLTRGELDLTQSVTIESLGSPATIDGKFTSRVFEVAARTHVKLVNLVIEDGVDFSSGQGNGIDNHGWLELKDCTLSKNGSPGPAGFPGSGTEGGGIYNDGRLILDHSNLLNNGAFIGGGIFNDTQGHVTVKNQSVLDSNSAFGFRLIIGGGGFGGGIGNGGGGPPVFVVVPGVGGGIANAGVLNVNDSTLSNNTTGRGPFFLGILGVGGGIANGGQLTVVNSTLSNNSSDIGGGIWNVGTNCQVTDSQLDFNTADVGGAIYNDGTGFEVSGCILSDNMAFALGGGIYNDTNGTLTVTASSTRRSFLSFNIAGAVGGGIYNAAAASAVSVGDSTFTQNTPDNIFGNNYTDLSGNTFI